MVDIYSEDFLDSLDIPINFNITNFLSEVYKDENSSTANGSLSEADKVKYEKALLNYHLMGIAGSTVCFVGIICNVLSVIVLTRRVMNSSTYSYLAALAVCDTLALVLTVSITLLSEDTTVPQPGKISWGKTSWAILFPYLHPAAVTFQVTSVWLTLAFTVDRYIMICHPFKAERMCSVGKARKVIIGMYIFGILFNIPRFLEYKTVKAELPSLNGGTETRMVIEYTEIGSSQTFMDLVHSYLYLTFVCGIPFFTLAILNTFLMHAVHISKKNGRLINAKEKRRNDTTIMLIGVIVLFLVCQGPALISRMVYAIDFHRATGSMTFHKINEVGNFLIIVNSAINIVPYYFFGKRFRREFWRLFCKCFLTNQELQKIKRNYSFSIDNNRRRISQCSAASQYEMNGFQLNNDQENRKFHRDSASPLLLHLEKVHRDSVQTVDTIDVNDRLSPSSFESLKRESPTPKPRLRKESPNSLRVVWEMDTNKNEKCNVIIDTTDTENTREL
ncbi:FMRFamide receptor-like [Mercenaria mercenaria]|uniref:FMRFamide receptor-like n=1 Tax=Mercenaria mercenaria TaxID=6596 RepID=UPI00234F86A4|nr:FMRFamide receptor-like [Mercenaria mercenaria]XP_053377871.1 FMRFamide receptor-like [Mercenaria mercenaria]XP_053377872.1 FMRFamide receptor-like [Mercenaria mercenaria]XP_053377873.1 FMRFamide receptor-like [Mercenaria mercenaria]XP_053377874.1 FMRFamide receptor-like [Mercenaria mercenaria]